MIIKSTPSFTLEVSIEEMDHLLAAIQHLRDNYPSRQKAAEKMYWELYHALCGRYGESEVTTCKESFGSR